MQQNRAAGGNAGPGTLAITTLALAIVGLFTGGLAAFPAIVTGHVEAARIRAGRSPQAGQRINRVGLVIAWIVVVVTVLLVAIVWTTSHRFMLPVLKDINEMAGQGRDR